MVTKQTGWSTTNSPRVKRHQALRDSVAASGVSVPVLWLEEGTKRERPEVRVVVGRSCTAKRLRLLVAVLVLGLLFQIGVHLSSTLCSESWNVCFGVGGGASRDQASFRQRRIWAVHSHLQGHVVQAHEDAAVVQKNPNYHSDVVAETEAANAASSSSSDSDTQPIVDGSSSRAQEVVTKGAGGRRSEGNDVSRGGRSRSRSRRSRKGGKKRGGVWVPNKKCANVEEMGKAAVGEQNSVGKGTLRVRRWIDAHFKVHGVEAVRKLPPQEFCKRGFVVGRMLRDGLGNNLYKVLNAAGLALMLNRSLIIAEHFSLDEGYVIAKRSEFKFPFGDYMEHSKEAFSMKDIKVLWVKNRCQEDFGRPLEVRTDPFQHLEYSQSLCQDWSTWDVPIILYKDAEDFTALQHFLKNAEPAMRYVARRLMGHTWDPDERPNVYGELMRFLYRPTDAIAGAVQWALKGGRSPDVAVHLRMMHDEDLAPEVAAESVKRALREARWQAPSPHDTRPRVAVVSDTEHSITTVAEALGDDYEVVSFNYQAWMAQHPNHPVMNNLLYQTPESRAKDWGPTPRWVAIVDFFLAARAKVALVAGARLRVATTFAQLAANLAASNALDERSGAMAFSFYSSFQESLLVRGLYLQSGRSFAWHTFSGNYSCENQPPQCALTPLQPYAWWDAPWQSPHRQALARWRNLGLMVGDAGDVSKQAVEAFCKVRKKVPVNTQALLLPTLEQLW